MKTAFLYPGQGAQYVGMAKDLYEASSTVREYFAIASDVLQKNMAGLLFDSDEEVLKVTENTQAAVTLANISAAQVLAERGVQPDVCAGFSVGEYAALHGAGVVSTADLFRLVAIRGELMERESRKHDTVDGPSAMSAVLGLTFDVAKPVVDSLAAQKVFIANHSSPSQIVLAGTAAGLSAAEDALKAAGAMKLVRLKVSGPFHAPLLQAAADEFLARIQNIPFADPQRPLISNVTAQPIQTGAEAKRLARDQIMSMVRWVDTMTWISKQGITEVLEVGPGKVLSGLWRAYSKETKCLPVGTISDMDSLAKN